MLGFHMKKEIITIGRIAGQYAKPRSNHFEYINNGNSLIKLEKVYVFRGEIVNDISHFKREADPERMYQAYGHSITTMYFIVLF